MRIYPFTKIGTARIRPSWTQQTRTTSITNGVCNFPITTTPQSNLVVCLNQVTLGKSPSAWRRAIKKGISATSDLVGTQYMLQGGEGYYTIEGTNPGGPYSTCWLDSGSGQILKVYRGGTTPPLMTTVNTLADAYAREALLGKYLKVRKKFRGGSFLAEFRDTVHMMKHPADSLYHGLQNFARGVGKLKRLKNSRDYAKALGDLYLSWSFGWKPLFNDVHDAAEALANLATSGRFDGKVIKGQGAFEDSFEYSPGNLNAFISMFRTDVRESIVAYTALIKSRPDSFATFADNFGVSAGDIIPAVWEAVPWSFFVDYFVNCNEVLDSLQWCEGDVGWVRRRVLNRNSIRYSVNANAVSALPAGLRVVCAISPMVHRVNHKVRSPSGIPYPSFRFRTPNMPQGFNIAALWAGIWGSKPAKSGVKFWS